MPTYTFLDKNTGETFDRFMTISARETFIQENPHIQQIIGEPPALADPVRIGITKRDSGFNEVLKRIHTNVPGSRLNDTNNF